MWQTANTALNTELAQADVNQSLAQSLAQITVPVNIAETGALQPDGARDNRRADIANLPVTTLLVSPWNCGEFSGQKSNMDFYLSPGDACQKMAVQFNHQLFESATLILCAADNVGQLVKKLALLVQSLPDQQLAQALRRAEVLAQHENGKRFIRQGVQALSADKTLDSLALFKPYQSALANISLSEALASDSNPVELLSDFIQRRNGRYAQIRQGLDDLNNRGALDYVLALSGNDLAGQLSVIDTPEPQAPFSVLLAFAGRAEALAEINQVLGL